MERPWGPRLRAAFLFLDTVDPVRIFRQRGAVMKSVPRFVKGPFRNALKFALEEALAQDEVQQVRGWKLLMLLPRMVLHRGPRGSLVPKSKLAERFELFAQGEWQSLLEASGECDYQAAVSRQRSRRRVRDDERRAARTEMLVGMGELSSARQALEGAELADGEQATLNVLRNPVRRPRALRDPLPQELAFFQPQTKFKLDRDQFNRNLRAARKGAAGGLSGMTTEHLRPLLEDGRGLRLLGEVAERLARAEVPAEVMRLVRGGRLTALSKPDGGVRGIVAGDVIRRLVARTMSQQLAKAAEAATAPHQYVLSTRAGCECVAHALQGLVELDPDTKIVSIDCKGNVSCTSYSRTFTIHKWLRQTAYILTHNLNMLEHIANNGMNTTMHTDANIAQF